MTYTVLQYIPEGCHLNKIMFVLANAQSERLYVNFERYDWELNNLKKVRINRLNKYSAV
jgi:hypothetical protein